MMSSRKIVPLVTVLVGIGICAYAIRAHREQLEHQTTLEILRQQQAEILKLVESKDRILSSHQFEIEQLHKATEEIHRLRGESQAARLVKGELEALKNRIAQLERSRPMSAVHSDPETIRASQLAAQRSIVVLEEQLKAHGEKLDSIKMNASNLLISLDIPEEIANKSLSEAMDSVSLRKYWPYFEARRERETQQRIVETINLRLLQETIDSRIQPQQ